MTPKAPRPVAVTGGSHGIAADCDAITGMAARFGDVAHDTLASTVTLHGYLANPTLAETAVLDPVGFAEFEADLLLALDDWQGLSWAGLECGAIDVELRVAATAYEKVDQIATDTRDLVLGAAGAGPALGAGAAVLGSTHDPIAAAQAVVTTDPRLADVLVGALGLPMLLRTFGGQLPDGHGVVRHAGVDRAGVAGRPPRSLADVLADLDRRNGDRHHGEIDVRILTLPDGGRRVIVDITGTKSWTPLPTRDVTSLTTNGRAVVGDATAYEGGVLAAMRRAGVRPDDDVMLVGHSEGGMVAVTTARDAVASGRFHVTHVVTAGSPIGLSVGSVPASVKVLALENSADVVPHLDGRANPDRPNVTTATARRGDGTISGDHGIGETYVPLAADVEASTDPSLRDFLTGARDWFRGATVDTRTYQIQRAS